MWGFKRLHYATFKGKKEEENKPDLFPTHSYYLELVFRKRKIPYTFTNSLLPPLSSHF
jgi:hypothetical protein